MRITLLALIVAMAAVAAHAQSNWAALLPEIPGCKKTIHWAGNGKTASDLSVEYKASDHLCGSIVLRREKDVLQKRKNFDYSEPTTRWVKVKGFEALQSSPLCGNDDWIGSLEVFFRDDMSITVNAYRWNATFLDFAQAADYRKLEREMKNWPAGK